MSKRDTPWYQRDRYYFFERDGKFYVNYAFRGSNFYHSKEFQTLDERNDFVNNLASTFVFMR
jgi:hypothetical protein